MRVVALCLAVLQIAGFPFGASTNIDDGSLVLLQHSAISKFTAFSVNNKSCPTYNRDGLKCENPETYYDFGAELRRDLSSVTKKVTSKQAGLPYTARIIKYDEDSIKFGLREYDVLLELKGTAGVRQMVDAYIVREYIILILEGRDDVPVLKYFSSRVEISEQQVAQFVHSTLEILADLHGKNYVVGGITSENMFVGADRTPVFESMAASQRLENRKAGGVVDLVFDTEFCAPEQLLFEPMLLVTDIWAVGVLTYILLGGESPFYYEDEDKVIESIENVHWQFEDFERVSSDAKDFIKRVFVRAQEGRITADGALSHPWFSNTLSTPLATGDLVRETNDRLHSEAEEEHVGGCFVFRTFEEQEYLCDEYDY